MEHPSGELATVRMTLDGGTYEEERGQVKFLGRVIASRWSRDEAVRLADGVVKVSGEFSRSGGSLAHPRVCPDGCQPVVLEIRDIPRESLGAERDLKWALVSTYPEAIKAKSDPEWHTIRLGSSLLTSYL